MGSVEDTNENALELIGNITRQILLHSPKVSKADLINALNKLSSDTDDWYVKAACLRALQMLKHRLH
ncbi:hypothetical protein [Pantoea sp. AMG 501]|uniref:hypothetical protein n=1 Tax=Pantoea sp. AMG 501 TaxID=2008894 RepID=UPI000B5A62D2|nr:hypothetical protein [Pantoea sp. AMG 501]OWY76506.1 hypothetical protein CDN97_14100 [Pantoea sp. AMG 501]